MRIPEQILRDAYWWALSKPSTRPVWAWMADYLEKELEANLLASLRQSCAPREGGWQDLYDGAGRTARTLADSLSQSGTDEHGQATPPPSEEKEG